MLPGSDLRPSSTTSPVQARVARQNGSVRLLSDPQLPQRGFYSTGGYQRVSGQPGRRSIGLVRSWLFPRVAQVVHAPVAGRSLAGYS